MKRLTSTIAVLLLASGVVASSSAFAASPGRGNVEEPDLAGYPVTTDRVGHRRFEQFLERYEAANSAFLNGDPEPWLALVTRNEPASILGGFGGLGEAGVAEVHQRYLLAATVFRPSGAEVAVQYLVKDVQGRIAYTVAIERADVLFSGHTALQPQILRVTMMFRFERGDWRIIHRHADTMVDLQLPAPSP